MIVNGTIPDNYKAQMIVNGVTDSLTGVSRAEHQPAHSQQFILKQQWSLLTYSPTKQSQSIPDNYKAQMIVNGVTDSLTGVSRSEHQPAHSQQFIL